MDRQVILALCRHTLGSVIYLSAKAPETGLEITREMWLRLSWKAALPVIGLMTACSFNTRDDIPRCAITPAGAAYRQAWRPSPNAISPALPDGQVGDIYESDSGCPSFDSVVKS